MPTYNAAHKRLFHTLGSATHRQCALFCDAPAHQWAHQRCPKSKFEPPDVGVGSHHGWFCEHEGWERCYVPACRSCHHRQDSLERAMEAMTPSQGRHARRADSVLRVRYLQERTSMREALVGMFGVDEADRIQRATFRGGYPRKTPTFLSDEQKREMARLRRAGAKITDLMKQFDVSMNRAMDYCRDY